MSHQKVSYKWVTNTVSASLSDALRGTIGKRIKNEAIKCHYGAFKRQFSFAALGIRYRLHIIRRLLAHIFTVNSFGSFSLLCSKLIAYSITLIHF